MSVWGSPSVALPGCGAEGAPGWPVSGLLAGARVWTHQGGVRGCGPVSPARPGPESVCGRMVPRNRSGRALVVAVFVWLAMVPLPAGDAGCSRVAVAAWCCGGCRFAARLAARSRRPPMVPGRT